MVSLIIVFGKFGRFVAYFLRHQRHGLSISPLLPVTYHQSIFSERPVTLCFRCTPLAGFGRPHGDLRAPVDGGNSGALGLSTKRPPLACNVSRSCMMKVRTLVIVACSLLAVLAVGLPEAHAQTRFDLSVGLKGGAMMSTATEVPNLTNEQMSEFNALNQDSGFYPAFGVGPAVGLALEARAWEVVGLETGFYYTKDDATGWNDQKTNGKDRGRVFMDQETSALHIPLLLKANAPTTTIKPFLGFGVEFILQQSSSLSYRGEPETAGDPYVERFAAQLAERNQIEPSSYTLLQLNFGIEIDLGELRIPVEFRSGYNLGWDSSLEARVEAEEQADGSTDLIYNGEYVAHFGVYTGVMYDFDFVVE